MKHAMLIGAMRSGTSTLHSHLSAHRNICSNYKEPDYFAGNLEGFTSYEEIWEVNDEHQYILDASTSYSKYPFFDGVPQRIHEYGLTPKFVYLLRNPIERIMSHMTEYRSMPTQHMISVSKYHMQIGRFLEYFNKDDILLLTLDEMQHDAQAAVDRVLTHLELPSIPVDSSVVVNSREWLRLPRPTATYYASRRYLEIETLLRRELADDMTSLRDNFNINVASWGF